MSVKKFLIVSLIPLMLSAGVFTLPVNNNGVVIETKANGLEDSVDGEEQTDDSSGDSGSSALSDYIKDKEGFTGDQLADADKKLSPLTNIFGYIVGGGVILVFAGVFVITALDLIYIVIPPTRNLLYKAGTDGTGAYTQGGYGTGYGMGGYGRGMGMAMGAQMGTAAGGTSKPTQWISDEAVACAAMLGGSSQAPSAMPGAMTGMPQNMPMKSVIFEYFKKRVFFMILLAICVIVLTSSILLGTGVNLAEWFLKIMGGVNESMPK